MNFQRVILPVLAMFAIFGWFSAEARPLPQDEAAIRFAEDARDHRIASNRLGATRGGVASGRMERWNTAPVSIEAIAGVLDPANTRMLYPQGTALLFYAPGDDHLAIYLIDASGLRAAALEDVANASLEAASLAFSQSLGVDEQAALRTPRLRDMPRFAGEVRASYDADAARLAEILLPPAIQQALGNVEHLIVVGNGVVASTPFAALPLADGRYLIDQATISMAGGIYDISRPAAPWAPDPETFARALVVGDPLAPQDGRWVVPRLPGAEREAREIAASWGVEPLLGMQATKQAVADAAGSAALIYIAAHATSDPDDPLKGGFVFLSGEDEEQAFWTAAEIQDRNLPAQLAVLSACQTGLGRNTDGGVIGLSRAFHLAGVPRVVMSLWSVDDAATYFLMTRFTAYARDHSPARALQLAMRDARAENDDPALWASFALFGTPR